MKKLACIACVALAGAAQSASAVEGPFSITDTADIEVYLSNGSGDLSVFSGTSNINPPVGSPIGQPTALNGASILSSMTMVRNTAASAASAGTVYTVTMNAVTFTASFFGTNLGTSEIVPSGTTIGGNPADSFTIDYGLGGNGADFSNAFAVLGGTSSINILSATATLWGAGVGGISTISATGIVNADLTVGASATWTSGVDFAPGDIADLDIAGGRIQLSVEVLPAPSSLALAGIGGLVATRRRRR